MPKKLGLIERAKQLGLSVQTLYNQRWKEKNRERYREAQRRAYLRRKERKCLNRERLA